MKDFGRGKIVAVFGSSAAEAGSAGYNQSYELGKALGRAGYSVVNGGYSGTMAGAARGAKEAGASTIGITCEAFGRGRANPFIDKEIKTKDLAERLDTLINMAQGYVFLPGGTGTLLELAMVWEFINKRFLARRPIICLSRYWKPVIDTIVQSGETNGGCLSFVETLDELLQILREYFDQQGKDE